MAGSNPAKSTLVIFVLGMAFSPETSILREINFRVDGGPLMALPLREGYQSWITNNGWLLQT